MPQSLKDAKLKELAEQLLIVKAFEEQEEDFDPSDWDALDVATEKVKQLRKEIADLN